MNESFVDLLRCPQTGARLAAQGELQGDLLNGALMAQGFGARWPSHKGFVKLFRESEVGTTDRLLRLFYDGVPRLHDPAVKWLLPLFQGATEAQTREGYWPLMELGAIEPSSEPFRVLEVGIGSGVNLDGFEARLPKGRPAHVVGLDLSAGMLGLCRRRPPPTASEMQVSLLLGDVHHLPFADGTFDRVLHVGATGSFSDPQAALAEMARVAKPGAAIVIVDEQIDSARVNGLLTRAAFKALTFYDRAPQSPAHLLPEDAYDVLERQISRFYYALRFRRRSRGD